ncbi:MAG: hypothetical protein GX986_02555 [Firmicutes bacterium]|nr:hypothetical protein [Bacillota bacterium]
MELFEELERIKIRFVAAYDKLVDQGLLSEKEYQQIVEVIDNLDMYSVDELREILGRFRSIQDLGNKHETNTYKLPGGRLGG